MKFKLKTKVTLGILFFFAELSVIAIMTIYFLSTINNRTELMIKNNYQSVQYAESMVQSIEEIHATVTSLYLNKLHHIDQSSLDFLFKKFEENLKNEEANITEFGEKELVQTIGQKYAKYKSMVTKVKSSSESDMTNLYFVNVSPQFNELKSSIFAVSNLNMQAIIQKNENLNATVSSIYKKLTGALAFCFLISVSFMLNFPNYISRPIKEITESIKSIALKKYNSSIKFSSEDELKQLTEAFNFMAQKLDEAPVVPQAQVAVNQPKPKLTDEGLVLENIQKLLGSVKILMDSLPQTANSEALQKQSGALSEVENELKKMVKSS